MFDYFYQLSDASLLILLSSVFIIVSIIAIAIVKITIPVHILYKDNPVIGNISSFISIIYGVLAGLMALYLINNINYTSDAVQREGNAVANIYRNIHWLEGPMQANMQLQIKQYIEQVVNVEWPLMEHGSPLDKKGDLIIENLAFDIYHYTAVGHTGSLIQNDLIDEVKTLYDARQQRIRMSFAALNPQIWVVVLLGTILSLGMNYLFGINFRLHVVSVSAAALMAASIIYLLISLDRPFQGDFIVEPDGLKSVLISINHDMETNKK